MTLIVICFYAGDIRFLNDAVPTIRQIYVRVNELAPVHNISRLDRIWLYVPIFVTLAWAHSNHRSSAAKLLLAFNYLAIPRSNHYAYSAGVFYCLVGLDQYAVS
jgi:hypothetical protein